MKKTKMMINIQKAKVQTPNSKHLKSDAFHREFKFKKDEKIHWDKFDENSK